MAEETTLRNDHFEVVVDRVTGGIRSIHDYRHRDNRLSQQIAFRLPGPRPKPGDVWQDPDLAASYSVMAADAVEVVSAGPVCGSLLARGRLLDMEGRELAGFRQTLTAWRGSPVLELEIELDVKEEPRADPWNSYYAARFAWADAAADLWRSVNQTCQPSSAKRLESPDFVELRTANLRTAILTGGWPYHRRSGLRMLDCLLIVRGETSRRFRLGVGVDLAHPIASAMDFLAPPLALRETAPPPASAVTSWLCHIDAKNVVATHWDALNADGKVNGFRVRLLETEGRAGRVRVRTFRPLASARQVDFQGQTLATLPLDDGAALVDLTAYEWAQVEAKW